MVVKTLAQLADLLGATPPQPAYADLPIEGVLGLDAASGRDLQRYITFAEDKRHLQEIEAANFGAVLLPPQLESQLPSLQVPQVRVAFAQLLEIFHPLQLYPASVHPTAVISPQAEVAASAYVGPYAIIEAGAKVGERCQVGAHCHLEEGVRVGDDTRLFPGVYLRQGTEIGRASLLGALTQVGPRAILQDDIEIGARCLLGACQIGAGVRIDNMVDIQDGVTIAPLAIIISQNCLRRQAKIGQLAIVAGHSLVQEGQEVGDYATIAASSLVDRPIPAGQEVWSGEPILPHRTAMRHVIERQLPLKYWKELQNLSKESPQKLQVDSHG